MNRTTVPIRIAAGVAAAGLAFALGGLLPTEAGELVRISVNPGTVLNTMRGGIGASWHAIEEPIPYSDQPDPVFGNKSHGGSGWGAYPPADDEAAWRQIDRHARWLGLDWNRVEFEQRIYEPEKDRFDWDNREMRILYRILDWCEKNRADLTIDPQSEFRLTEGASEFRDRLPPMSLTVYTTYRLAHGDPGILDE